jgi:hypothetical protein
MNYIGIYIYCLNCPISNEPKYIGKTNYIKERFKSHLKSTQLKIKNKKNSWIKSLLKQNLRPRLEILDIVNVKEWEFWEIFYINLYRSWGFDLKNMDNGGCGGKILSNETKNKLRQKNLGRKQSEETKLKKIKQFLNL